MTELVMWKPGQQMLYRFRRMDGSLGAVHPARVLADDGEQLLCWVVPGTTIRMTTAPDGRATRELPLEQRFVAGRAARSGMWRDRATLRLVFEDRWASVWWFFEPDGTFRNWYVNLEIPLGRDETGIDRADGVLDLEVLPDGRWSWKDEDEAVAAIDAGRFDALQMKQLRTEGERLIDLVEAGRFPFDGSYCTARPEPSWPLPELPAELLT